VLGGLGRVKLADGRNPLGVISVREAILCVVGYRIGTELVRAEEFPPLLGFFVEVPRVGDTALGEC
jgi:hypothetical protein